MVTGFWAIVGRLYSVELWRAAKCSQPEPKALRNVAWSLPTLAIVVLAYPIWSAFHNAAMLGIWLVGVSAGLVFFYNLVFLVVKQFIRR